MGIFHTINTIESIINELLRYVNIIIIHVDLQRVIIINIKKRIDLECNVQWHQSRLKTTSAKCDFEATRP